MGDVIARYTAFHHRWVRKAISQGCRSGAELNALWNKNKEASRQAGVRGHRTMVENHPMKGKLL